MSSMKNVVDLRSDTVTRPTPAMREAIAAAIVGDDVFGDDPTVNALQERTAALLGKEAALFVASGTQGNLCALLAHCERGDEALVGQMAHTYRYEGGGGAVLGGIQPQPLPQQSDGTLLLADIEAAIKPDDEHFARTRLLCLENTWNGKVLPRTYLTDATALAHRRGLAAHLDGARLFNAAVATGIAASEQARAFDSVWVDFSKGLGAPGGAVLAGTREFVREANRWKQRLGGAMRQSGIIAAACEYALDHHVSRLADDHANARRLAAGIAAIDGLRIDTAAVETNLVFFDVVAPAWNAQSLCAALLQHGVRMGAMAGRMRAVTHLDVDSAGIDAALSALRTLMRA